MKIVVGLVVENIINTYLDVKKNKCIESNVI